MISTFNEYQVSTATTAIYPREQALSYLTLGLAGEAGEVANKVKKIIRDTGGHVNDQKKKEIIDELGDVMWYISELCTELGVPLSAVATLNIDKLQGRARDKQLQGDGDNR